MKNPVPCLIATCDALLDDPVACQFCIQALRGVEIVEANQRFVARLDAAPVLAPAPGLLRAPDRRGNAKA